MLTKKDRPKLKHLLAEGARTSAELSALLSPASAFYLTMMTPNGSGQPVMVLPGFMAGDWSSKVLREFLNFKGYDAYGWDAGTNLKPDAQMMTKLVERINEIHEQTGQKVALVGHSLGGVISREIARAFPDLIDKVVTLGSPFGGSDNPDATSPLVREIFKAINPDAAFVDDPEVGNLMVTPPDVPTTSIYTRTDGVVHWKICLNPECEHAENIEIPSSHCGLIVNPFTYAVLMDRLAQSADDWKPFDKADYTLLNVLLRRDQAHDDYVPDMPEEVELDRSKHPMFN